MTLSDRVKFFLQSALGAGDIRDEFISSIDDAINHPVTGFQFIIASGGTTVITDTSVRTFVLLGTGSHTIKLPPISQLALGEYFTFANKSTGNLNILKADSDASNVAGDGGVVLGTPIVPFYQAICRKIIFNFSDNHIQWGAHCFPIQNNSFQLSAGSAKLLNVADPTSATDAANKEYVDNKVLTFASDASAGGAATEVYVVTGILATDTILSVSQSVPGANNLPLLGYNTLANNALTGVYSADPGAGAIINVTVKR